MAKQLTNNPSDGTNFGGSATELIGFYGKAPSAQRANATQATITAGATTTVCNNAVAEVQTVLIALGLMKGSA